ISEADRVLNQRETIDVAPHRHQITIEGCGFARNGWLYSRRPRAACLANSSVCSFSADRSRGHMRCGRSAPSINSRMGSGEKERAAPQVQVSEISRLAVPVMKGPYVRLGRLGRLGSQNQEMPNVEVAVPDDQ